ncbi:kelch-like protein 40 [Plakobranchus ocellatus]|uniref:Kelch-like protein 40 n=1 Tax=Plakobranchus ocellatus TaxID=259542 RepID=A0AAV4AX38_9GAST|nr:kelch-like protein 40 [Plakobranchus ocellatus]
MDGLRTEADREIMNGFFDALKDQKENAEFSDVIVQAGSRPFQCHRVLLSTVSGYFRGLFSSGMRETLEGKVILEDISEDVFSQVLSSIYSGRSILSKENIFEIWSAVDFLDIGFLLKQCKAFFSRTLSVQNCFRYCVSIRLLDEEHNRKALSVIISNFEHVRFSDELYELTFEEMKYIVSSIALAVSCEDDVIETVLRWAESTSTLNMQAEESANSKKKVKKHAVKCQVVGGRRFAYSSRKQKSSSAKTQSTKEKISDVEKESQEGDESSYRSELLAELLESCRYLLVSNACLVNILSCHPLIENNARCVALVDQIGLHLARTELHQECCPPAAIHRESQALVNVFVESTAAGEMAVIYPHNAENYFTITETIMGLPRGFKPATNMSYHDGCLYIFQSSPKPGSLSFFSPSSNGWKSIETNKQPQFAVLIANAIYTIETTDQDETNVFKLNLRDAINQYPDCVAWKPVCRLAVEGLSVKAITGIENRLLVFWAGPSMENFTVECYDLFRRTSTVMENQLGSAANIVLFRKDEEAFALQANGALWRVRICPSNSTPVFTQELHLWDGSVLLSGALLYDKTLYIFGNYEDLEFPCLDKVSLDGVFNGIVFPERSKDIRGSSFVNAVLPRHVFPAL